MNIGKNIKTLRKLHGITQIELAKKLKTEQRTISEWEINKRIPTIENLVEIATVFQESLDRLVMQELELTVQNKDSKTMKEKS